MQRAIAIGPSCGGWRWQRGRGFRGGSLAKPLANGRSSAAKAGGTVRDQQSFLGGARECALPPAHGCDRVISVVRAPNFDDWYLRIASAVEHRTTMVAPNSLAVTLLELVLCESKFHHRKDGCVHHCFALVVLRHECSRSPPAESRAQRRAPCCVGRGNACDQRKPYFCVQPGRRKTHTERSHLG